MRLKVGRLRRLVKRDLPIEFGREQLTSYGGLELLRRYFQLIGLTQRLRRGFREHQLGGDYGCAHLVLLVIALLVVGARRLQHLRYVAADALFARLCGLARIPSDRTVVNWLKQFTQASLRALARVNSELLYEQIQQLDLRRLTIDVDGTVIRTGGKVAWAMRGFNPHHPKDPSYYPLLARRGCFYAIKVPFCKWTGIKALVAAQQQWTPVDSEVSGFETRLKLKPWELALRVVVYRKRVHHQSPKNYQLDLFSPDDGYFEYSAVTTNLALTPRRRCGTSAPAAGRRRRPSLSSRVNSLSMWFPLITTAPIAPGSSSRSSPTTCSAAFSCTRPSRHPSRARASAPMPTGSRV